MPYADSRSGFNFSKGIVRLWPTQEETEEQRFEKGRKKFVKEARAQARKGPIRPISLSQKEARAGYGRYKVRRGKKFLGRSATPSALKKFEAEERLRRKIGKLSMTQTREFQSLVREKERRQAKVLLRQRGLRFGEVGRRTEVPFTQEQDALNEMFGGGGKIWGTEMQPVTLYNDLNPSKNGDIGTGEMFGIH